MSSYDPQQVGHYGKIVETWAAERYGLELTYPERGGLKFDAIANGTVWDVKGCNVDGVRPTFKFWKDQHEVLHRENGGYVLVWYRVRNGDAVVSRSRSIRAAALRISNWTNPGATHHRSHTKEAQVPAGELSS